MQKIGNLTDTATSDGEFTDGNVAGGVSPTILPAAWFNTIQRELVNAIEGAGITLDPDNNSQLLSALLVNSPGRLLNIQTFTASGTYTPTAGTQKVRIKAWGAGGGGGGMGSSQASVAGAAGAYAEAWIDLDDATSVPVTIGAGGVSVAANSSAKGGDGGNTLFGTLVSCPGGKGGDPSGPLPTGGVPTGGNIMNITGQGGQGGAYINEILNNGLGGSSYGGYNAVPHVSSAADNGSFPGGGGAIGSYVSATVNFGSGKGGDGLIIVEEYA